MSLLDFVTKRFGGKLYAGSHEPDGCACIFEACSIARGLDWTDDPTIIGMPDMRPLNDADWPSDEERAREMCTVADSLWDWADWPEAWQVKWAHRVALRTTQEVLPLALEATGFAKEAEACRAAKGLEAAARAAEEAAVAAAEAAAVAAAWAAENAAANAAADVLRLTCRIWREEAEKAWT